MASSTARSVIERATAAFNRHDMNAWKASVTEDVRCTAPGGVQLQGKQAVASFYQAWIDGFPDGQVTSEVHTTDDGCVEVGTFSGTHRGVLRAPDGDIPPTGRKLSARFIEVTQIKGDLIASLNLMYDRMDMIQQLGLMESASQGANREAATTQPAAPH